MRKLKSKMNNTLKNLDFAKEAKIRGISKMLIKKYKKTVDINWKK